MTLRETYEAVAVGHRGNELGRWQGENVKSLMQLADEEAPTAFSVTIRGEYTSDGTRWRNHGGRVVATRERGPDRGRGGWSTSYGHEVEPIRKALSGSAPPDYYRPSLPPGSRRG